MGTSEASELSANSCSGPGRGNGAAIESDLRDRKTRFGEECIRDIESQVHTTETVNQHHRAGASPLFKFRMHCQAKLDCGSEV